MTLGPARTYSSDSLSRWRKRLRAAAAPAVDSDETSRSRISSSHVASADVGGNVELLEGTASIESRAAGIPERTGVLRASLGLADGRFQRAEPCRVLDRHAAILAAEGP